MSSSKTVLWVAVAVVSFVGFFGQHVWRLSQASKEARAPIVASAAQRDLRVAASAAHLLYGDAHTFLTVTPEKLQAIEPSLRYDSSGYATVDIVSVRDVQSRSILFATRSADGDPYCLVFATDAAPIYGSTDATTSADCTGEPW